MILIETLEKVSQESVKTRLLTMARILCATTASAKKKK
jgi:hypothetical protein